jgi:hypothetical protein
MSTTDEDLVAVRTLADEVARGRDRDTGPALARVWERVDPGRPRARRPWVSRRLAVPVMAAVAVLALAGGAVVYLSAKPGPGTQSPASETFVPAADIFRQVTERVAGSPPAPVNPPRYVYVRSDGTAAAFGAPDAPPTYERDRHEAWFDSQGGIAVAIRRGEQWLQRGVDDPQSPVRADVERFEAEGPGVHYPTVEWLREQLADPAALTALVRRQAGEGKTDGWADNQVWEWFVSVLYRFDPLLGPADRQRVYAALAAFGSLSGYRTTIDGVAVLGVRLPDDDGKHATDVLFDPDSGRAIGQRSVFGDQLMSEALWTAELVAIPPASNAPGGASTPR